MHLQLTFSFWLVWTSSLDAASEKFMSEGAVIDDGICDWGTDNDGKSQGDMADVRGDNEVVQYWEKGEGSG